MGGLATGGLEEERGGDVKAGTEPADMLRCEGALAVQHLANRVVTELSLPPIFLQ